MLSIDRVYADIKKAELALEEWEKHIVKKKWKKERGAACGMLGLSESPVGNFQRYADYPWVDPKTSGRFSFSAACRVQYERDNAVKEG